MLDFEKRFKMSSRDGVRGMSVVWCFQLMERRNRFKDQRWTTLWTPSTWTISTIYDVQKMS